MYFDQYHIDGCPCQETRPAITSHDSYKALGASECQAGFSMLIRMQSVWWSATLLFRYVAATLKNHVNNMNEGSHRQTEAILKPAV